MHLVLNLPLDGIVIDHIYSVSAEDFFSEFSLISVIFLKRRNCTEFFISLGRGGVASPMLGRLLSQGKAPRYSFYRRLSGPQDQSGHEDVKKNLHLSDARDQTRVV